MQVRLSHDAPLGVRAGALVVPFFSDNALEGVAQDIDAALGGVIADALASGEIRGQPRRTRARLRQGSAVPSRSRRCARRTREVRAVFSRALRRNRGSLPRPAQRRDDRHRAAAAGRGQEATCASFVAEGAITGSFDTTHLSGAPGAAHRDAERRILSDGLDRRGSSSAASRAGSCLGEAVNLARRLAITPANDMTPTRLAEEAAAVAKERRARASRSSTKPARAAKRHGLLSLRRARQRAAAEVHRSALRRRPVEQRASRARRQGHHVRHRRHLDQAGRANGRDEVRHVRRRRRDRRDVRDRASSSRSSTSSASCRRPKTCRAAKRRNPATS